jgi:DNA repair exonuclease SbcCD ATPase subunit
MNRFVAKDSTDRLLTFQRILADRKDMSLKIATKQEEADKEKNKQILQTAASYTVDNIVKGLAELQLEFGGIVNGLSEKLSKETSKLDELKRAIEVETQNLQELQQIRIVADILYILNQEHQEKLKLIEQGATTQQENLEKEITQTRKTGQQEQVEFETNLQYQNELLVKERQREIEEYQYRLAQTQKINADTYQLKKRTLEREIEEATQAKEKDWAEREKVLTEQQSLLGEYTKQIAAFPTELEEAVKKAREEAIKDVNQDAKVKADLFEKEWQAAKQSYELQVQSLEQVITRQIEQIENLTAQMQAAQQQAQELALRAFQNGTRG